MAKDISFFESWSNDLAYIVGFAMADGCVNNQGLHFGLKTTDKCILEFISSKIKPSPQIRDTVVYDSRTDKYRHRSMLDIYSKKLVTIIEDYCLIPRKTGKEKIPSNIPYNYIADFIRGMFDGDGSVGCYKGSPLMASICSSSYSFLEDLQYLCGKIGTIHKSNSIFQWRMSVIDSLKFKNIIYNGRFCLQRKKDIFDNYDFVNYNKRNK